MSNPQTYVNYAARSLLLPALATDVSRQSSTCNDTSEDMQEESSREIDRPVGSSVSSWQAITRNSYSLSSNYSLQSHPSISQHQVFSLNSSFPTQGLGLTRIDRSGSNLWTSSSLGQTNGAEADGNVAFSVDEDDTRSDLSSLSPIPNSDTDSSSSSVLDHIDNNTFLRIGKGLMHSFSDVNVLERFKCSICLDTIVGAAVLDCESNGGHTFCSECIQQFMAYNQESRNCPNCRCSFTKLVPCRDLDNAILYALNQALIAGEIGEKDACEYHERLAIWREHIRKLNGRNKENNSWHRVQNGFSRVIDYFSTVQISSWASAAALSVIVIALGSARRN